MKGIYGIKSPKNKIYVGKSRDIDKRWNSYKRLECKGQPKLFYSLAKYGWKNHKFWIIEECNNIGEREKYWIKKYDSEFKGLNTPYKGNKRSGYKLPQSAIEKKSLKMKKLWENGEFKRNWAKKIIHNPTKKVFNSIKEAINWKGFNHKSYTTFYKMVGNNKEFSYINV